MPQTNRAVDYTVGNASDEPTAPDSPPCPIYCDVDETNIRPCYQDFDWVGLGIKFAHHQMSKGLWDKTTARKYLATMVINKDYQDCIANVKVGDAFDEDEFIGGGHGGTGDNQRQRSSA